MKTQTLIDFLQTHCHPNTKVKVRSLGKIVDFDFTIIDYSDGSISIVIEPEENE